MALQSPHDPPALPDPDRLFRALVEQVPAVVYVATNDAPPSILYVSPQVTEMLGYQPDACLDDPEMWPRTIHPGRPRSRGRGVDGVDQDRRPVLMRVPAVPRGRTRGVDPRRRARGARRDGHADLLARSAAGHLGVQAHGAEAVRVREAVPRAGRTAPRGRLRGHERSAAGLALHQPQRRGDPGLPIRELLRRPASLVRHGPPRRHRPRPGAVGTGVPTRRAVLLRLPLRAARRQHRMGPR